MNLVNGLAILSPCPAAKVFIPATKIAIRPKTPSKPTPISEMLRLANSIRVEANILTATVMIAIWIAPFITMSSFLDNTFIAPTTIVINPNTPSKPALMSLISSLASDFKAKDKTSTPALNSSMLPAALTIPVTPADLENTVMVPIKPANNIVIAANESDNFSLSINERTKIDPARIAIAMAIFLSASAFKLFWNPFNAPLTDPSTSFILPAISPKPPTESPRFLKNLIRATPTPPLIIPFTISRTPSISAFAIRSSSPPNTLPKNLPMALPTALIPFHTTVKNLNIGLFLMALPIAENALATDSFILDAESPTSDIPLNMSFNDSIRFDNPGNTRSFPMKSNRLAAPLTSLPMTFTTKLIMVATPENTFSNIFP